jgi:hypothetical protein
VPVDGITIVPIGDIHFNAPMFAADVFDAWCAKWKKKQNVYYVGVGDYLETLSTSERKALAQIHSSSREWMDSRIMEDVDKLAAKLEFTKGRWLGMLCGNHNHISADGMTITQLLAKRLDAPALGVCAAIRLILNRTNSSAHLVYDIWAHHGTGGGVLAGSTINALERWSNGLDADMALMGHDHKKVGIQIERLGLTGNRDTLRPKTKTITLIRTGGFMKAYEKGKVSYLVERAARPLTLGTASAHIRLWRNKDEGDVMIPITEVTT